MVFVAGLLSNGHRVVARMCAGNGQLRGRRAGHTLGGGRKAEALHFVRWEGGTGNRAPGPHAHRKTARQAMDGLWTEVCGQQKQSNDPGNNQHNPQYANYWAPLMRKRHIPPHPAQPRHTNHWAPRTRKRHQQEHRPQQPTESSDPTQHAKGRTGDCPGPRKGATTRRNVTQAGRTSDFLASVQTPETALRRLLSKHLVLT